MRTLIRLSGIAAMAWAVAAATGPAASAGSPVISEAFTFDFFPGVSGSSSLSPDEVYP